MNKLRVTVFGGSAPRPGEPAYEEAVHLGTLLGQAGHTVLTGGYMGTMEAVSRGANQAGGHVIGVTCLEIERWRNARANPWVIEEWQRPTLRERLFALIDHCDAALALPGGPGTLAEISLMWNQMIIAALPPRPLVLIGPGWQQTITTLYQALGDYIPDSQRRWLSLVPNVNAALAVLQGKIGEYV